MTSTGTSSSGSVAWKRAVTAVPDAALATAFLVTWLRPFALGERVVEYFLITMLLEFIIVHSTALMGAVAMSDEPGRAKLKSLVGLAGLYTLFVAGFAVGFGVWWPLLAFWGLTFNRMLGVILGEAPRGRERQYVKAGWALSVVYFLVGATAVTFLPIPELGVTPDVRAQLALPGGGLWIDEPQRVLAFGVFYFGLTAVGEALGWGRSETALRGVPRDPAP